MKRAELVQGVTVAAVGTAFAATATFSSTEVAQAQSGRKIHVGFSAPGANVPQAQPHIGAPSLAASAMNLARLIGLGRGLSETAEKVVPSSITLYSAVVTKDNVAQYADAGF